MVPGVAVVIPVYLVTSKLGQLDTYHVLIIIFTAFNLPFAIWLLRSFFQEIAPELREAAIIDGCSEIGVFIRIMLPLAMGGIIATGVFVFIADWNEFLFALVLTNSRVATAPLAILGFRTEYGTQWSRDRRGRAADFDPRDRLRHPDAEVSGARADDGLDPVSYPVFLIREADFHCPRTGRAMGSTAIADPRPARRGRCGACAALSDDRPPT